MNKKTLALLAVLLASLVMMAWLLMQPEQTQAVSAQASPVKTAAEPQPAAVTTPKAQEPAISISVLEPETDPLYVFIMIGDGMGENQRRLAQLYYRQMRPGDELIMDSLPVSQKITTHSLNAKVTDSAASSTAIATGYKTNNGMLAVTPEGESLKTIMEQAEEQGLSTGIVTTTTLTNATPAGFASHNKKRAADSEIALNYLNSGIDFFAGGGASFFLPAEYSGGLDAAGKELKSSRKDGEDPLSSLTGLGYTTFIGEQGAHDFMAFNPDEDDKVFASFTNAHMPYEADRLSEDMASPTLLRMTEKAIETLAFDEDGFVLMVEGGRIDHACHNNDVNGAVLETLEFDKAVKAAYDFYTLHPEDTLLIVLADHETGGLRLGSGDLDFQSISGVRASIAERVMKRYDGDRLAFYDYIAENMGLGDLNPGERARLDKALGKADKADPKKGYGSVVGLAVSKIISERAGVSWKYTDHTNALVPLTAAGYMSQELLDVTDNAGVGQFLFDVLASD